MDLQRVKHTNFYPVLDVAACSYLVSCFGLLHNTNIRQDPMKTNTENQKLYSFWQVFNGETCSRQHLLGTGLAIAGTLFSHPKVNSCPTFCGINQRMSHQQWKVEQLLTVETRTNLPFVSSAGQVFQVLFTFNRPKISQK